MAQRTALHFGLRLPPLVPLPACLPSPLAFPAETYIVIPAVSLFTINDPNTSWCTVSACIRQNTNTLECYISCNVICYNLSTFPLVSPFPRSLTSGIRSLNQFSSFELNRKKKAIPENARNSHIGDLRRVRGNDGGFCALPAFINSHIGNTATQANPISRIFVKLSVNRTLSNVMICFSCCQSIASH